MKLEFIMKGLCLLPVGDDSHEFCKKNQGRSYVIPLKNQRNPRFHNRAMAMFRQMHDMADVDIAFDPWRKWLAIQTGYCRTTGFPDGSVLVEPASWAFESMSQEKFETVWRDMHQKFCQIYGDKMTYDQLTEWSVM